MPAPTIATESFVISLPRKVFDAAKKQSSCFRWLRGLSDEADIARNRIWGRKQHDARVHCAFVAPQNRLRGITATRSFFGIRDRPTVVHDAHRQHPRGAPARLRHRPDVA